MLLGIIKRRIPDEKKYFKRLMKEFKLILLFDFEKCILSSKYNFRISWRRSSYY